MFFVIEVTNRQYFQKQSPKRRRSKPVETPKRTVVSKVIQSYITLNSQAQPCFCVLLCSAITVYSCSSEHLVIGLGTHSYVVGKRRIFSCLFFWYAGYVF